MTPEEQAAADAEAAEKQKAEDEAKAALEAEALAEKEFESGYTGAEAPVVEKTAEEITEEAAAAEMKAAEDAKALEAAKAAELTPPLTDSEKQLQDLIAKVGTIDDVKVLVEKIRGDAFGKIGGLERTIKALQDTTPVGQPIVATPEDFAELMTDLPDVAPKLLTGLTRVLSKFKGTAQAAAAESPEQFEERVNKAADARVAQRLLERDQRDAMKEVSKKHSDWNTVIGPENSQTEFRQWLKTQPHEFATTFLKSWDPEVVVDGLNKFKEFKTPKPAPKPAATKTRTQLLSEAVPARGGVSAPSKPRQKTPEEEFEEGFKSQ